MKKQLLTLLSLAIVSISFGQSWTTQNSKVPVSGAGLSRISIKDANIAWASFYNGNPGAPSQYLKYVSVTANGGTTWTSKLVSNLPTNALISDIQTIDSQKAFIVTAPESGSGAANGLWKTENGGTSWTKVTGVFSNASFGNIVYFWDTNNGIVIGDPVNGKYEMYKTTDGGNSWSVLTTAPSQTNDDYGYVGGKVVFGENVWLTSNTGKILHTADRGLTWKSYFAPIDDFEGEEVNGSMSFSSATYGLIVDNSSTLWFTEDGGQNWDIKASDSYFDGDIQYVPGSTNTFISTGINGSSSLGTGSAYSNDGGQNWTVIESGTQTGTLGAYDCNTVWAGQFTSDAAGTGGLLKLDGGVPNCSLAVNDQVLSKVELKAVVNANTLNIIASKEVKSVLVGDMTGRKLTEVNSKNVNVSNLKPGVYYARVAYADGAFGTVKFIIK